MEISIEVYEHGRLVGVTFTEVFRELAGMARLNWERRQVMYHNVGCARDGVASGAGSGPITRPCFCATTRKIARTTQPGDRGGTTRR